MNGEDSRFHFFKSYLQVVATFILSRLLIQTDILFVAPLGPEATAAFSVPGRLMFIDAIVAFSLAPAISIAVSRESDERDRSSTISRALTLTLLISCALVIVGLVVYPWLIEIIVADTTVQRLGQAGVFWMTLSIPVRMLSFVATMCLFACNQGRRINYIYAVTLGLNTILDWLLIYSAELGVAGAFLATGIVSVFELGWLLWLVSRVTRKWPFGPLDIGWTRALSKSVGAEWVRLLSWQAEGLVIISLLGWRTEWLPAFSAYGVITELMSFLSVPLIALMRAGSMHIAARNPSRSTSGAWQIAAPWLPWSLLGIFAIGISLSTLSTWLGQDVYQLKGQRLEWWSAFTSIYGFVLAAAGLSCIARACFQATERFLEITVIEVLITWGLFLPLLWYSLVRWEPNLFFVAFLLRELLVVGILMARSFRPVKQDCIQDALP